MKNLNANEMWEKAPKTQDQMISKAQRALTLRALKIM